jgi:hypothetical protein
MIDEILFVQLGLLGGSVGISAVITYLFGVAAGFLVNVTLFTAIIIYFRKNPWYVLLTKSVTKRLLARREGLVNANRRVNYFCLVCGSEVRGIKCIKCGSNMKKATFR